ncbi:MAG: hypothetical protein LC754_09065 [Acidobacteria bacterium]|nr:hypothetical protein [Acidobacteriota bacterium]
MSTQLTAIVVAVIGFAVFFFVVKRVLRMAIRLALVGAVLFALLAGAVAWWWYGASLSDFSPTQNRNTATRPARTNR